MNTLMRESWLPVAISVALGVGLTGCGHATDAGSAPVSQVPQLPLDQQLVAAGQHIFRYDTFGDETFWTDTLKVNTVIESGSGSAHRRIGRAENRCHCAPA